MLDVRVMSRRVAYHMVHVVRRLPPPYGDACEDVAHQNAKMVVRLGTDAAHRVVTDVVAHKRHLLPESAQQGASAHDRHRAGRFRVSVPAHQRDARDEDRSALCKLQHVERCARLEHRGSLRLCHQRAPFLCHCRELLVVACGEHTCARASGRAPDAHVAPDLASRHRMEGDGVSTREQERFCSCACVRSVHSSKRSFARACSGSPLTCAILKRSRRGRSTGGCMATNASDASTPARARIARSPPGCELRNSVTS